MFLGSELDAPMSTPWGSVDASWGEEEREINV